MLKFSNGNILGILLVSILTITVVYSSFNEKLIVDGTAYVRVDEDRVTDVTLSSSTSNAYET